MKKHFRLTDMELSEKEAEKQVILHLPRGLFNFNLIVHAQFTVTDMLLQGKSTFETLTNTVRCYFKGQKPDLS